MSFHWHDYVGVADHLVNGSRESPCPEAYERAAISRAYYAALNPARNLLRDEWGIQVPEAAEVHTFVCRWFLADDDEDRQAIGLLLDRLRDRRRRADYSDALPRSALLAELSLADARLAVEALSRL